MLRWKFICMLKIAGVNCSSWSFMSPFSKSFIRKMEKRENDYKFNGSNSIRPDEKANLHLIIPNYWWKNCFNYAFAKKSPMKWPKTDQFFPNSHQNLRVAEICSNRWSDLPQMKGTTTVWSARRGEINGECFLSHHLGDECFASHTYLYHPNTTGDDKWNSYMVATGL